MDITPVKIEGTATVIGDMIRLKSGGPTMTVISIDEHRQELRCIWQAGETIGCRDFSATSLQRVIAGTTEK